MSSGDINHIRILVSNLAKSLAFYTNLLAALNYRVAHQTSQTITNETSFLKPQMTQIDADGEKDKRTPAVIGAAWEGEAPAEP
jgi:hypothetical protein